MRDVLLHTKQIIKIDVIPRSRPFYSRPNICKSWCLNAHFIPNNSDLVG